MNVLLITSGIFHPPLWGRLALHKALAESGGCDFKMIHSLEQLPADLESFSALVLHFHHRRISPAALVKLDAFVRGGGGVLAIHAATASFKETPAYFDILGGRFTGHGTVEKFAARRIKDEVFGGIGDFTVIDELYLHELKPGLEVHFTANYEGKAVPVVWTQGFGTGRVCYACPGHISATMRNPAYQEVLRRGLLWVGRQDGRER